MSSPVTGTLPARLRLIYEAVQQSERAAPTPSALRQDWDAYLAQVRQDIRAVHIEGGGEIVYLGELSPGCQACKDGTWDCVFTTVHCNLSCAFCCNPHAIPPDYAGSAFGHTPEQITDNYARTHITGISFSGGDPFVDVEKLFDWIARFKRRRPDAYTWLYTNGLLADAPTLRRLAELGIDEIRFNMAATGYTHPVVLANVAAAARQIPTVTVEIPAIPEDADKLLNSLEVWCAHGVRFLNLHELMFEPGTNAAALSGPRQTVITPDGHRTAIHPDSRALTLAVMRRVQAERLPLSVNDCSMQSKFRQLRGRRRCLAPLMRAPHEQHSDTVYESCCAFWGDDVRFFHPDALADRRREFPDHRFVKLTRIAPLSVFDDPLWIAFEEL
ncbi:MAG: 4Fe-4S cluster-binding domain-containing protein [Anaerolineae bacterium]|nr:4Fe-4S cluster-binding domain-containing protein [Anaerolineae bacterium]